MPELLSPPVSAPFPPMIAEVVRDAATDFFRSSCGLKHKDKPDDDAPSGAGIMSTIAFMGDQPWSFSIVIPDHTAVALARAFAGFDVPLDSPDMGDVIGEVVNVIAGGICARLDARGFKCQMSLPTVVRGENVSVLVPSGAATRRIAFTGPHDSCWVRLVKARTFNAARMPGV